MKITTNNQKLWGYLEYALKKDKDYIELKCFQLILPQQRVSGVDDTYLFEKITRGIVAKWLKSLKYAAETFVNSGHINDLGELINQIKSSLANEIMDAVHVKLHEAFNDFLVKSLTAGEQKSPLLLMTAVYYVYFKNVNSIPNYSLAPFFFNTFIPLYQFAKRDDIDALKNWHDKLAQRLLECHATDEDALLNWRDDYFEDAGVRKNMSVIFAQMYEYLSENKQDAVKYMGSAFSLSDTQIQALIVYIANGFHTAINKNKRFVLKSMETYSTNNGDGHRLRQIVNKDLFQIISECINIRIDIGADKITEYFQSIKTGKAKRYLLEQFEKEPARLNRNLWKDICELIGTRERELYRNKILLRVLIYFMFEKTGLERVIWIKYINIIEKTVSHVYKNREAYLYQIESRLNETLSEFKNKTRFNGTDWEGFYGAKATMLIANELFKEVIDKLKDPDDSNQPAAWFVSFLQKAIDSGRVADNPLSVFKFFKGGLKHVKQPI